ncbi:hypothetical protein D3C81_1152350 [compost metagenome]
MHGLGEFAGEAQVRRAGFAPHQIGMRCVGDATADGLLQAVLDAVEALRRALAGDERCIVRVEVAGQQVGRFGIGPRQHDRRHTQHVSRQTRRRQLLDGFLGRHQHLAAHVAALLHRRQLVLEMHRSGAGDDHVLHQLVGVEHAAETGLTVGDDGQEEVDRVLGLHLAVDDVLPLDFIGALEGVVDAADHGRHRVVGIQRLVRVHGFGGVAVGGNLPARQIHRFQPGLGLLHRLAGADRTKRIDVVLLRAAIDQLPQALGAALGQRVLRPHAAAQAHHVGGAVGALQPLPTRVGVPVLLQGIDLLLVGAHRVVLE